MHVTECVEQMRQFRKWFAKSCAFVVLVLKISSSGRIWFKIGIVQSLELMYFWKRVRAPSTAGDCDLVGDTLTCTELWRAESVTGSQLTWGVSLLSDSFSSVPDRPLRVTLFTASWSTHPPPLCSSLVVGPWLGVWVALIICYILCIEAGVTGRREFAPELLLGPVWCSGAALSVCSLSCDMEFWKAGCQSG